MNIEYIGKGSMYDYFNCDICDSRSREKFKVIPSLPTLASWEKMHCCKKCAQREIGSKNKKKLIAIMEKINEQETK